MKLLLENWRQYLAESERLEKAKAEYKKLFNSGLIEPDVSFLDWIKDKSGGSLGFSKQALAKIRRREQKDVTKGFKNIYKQHADRDFLNSLIYIHWDRDPVRYLTAGAHHQTSAEGYLPQQKVEQSYDAKEVEAFHDPTEGATDLAGVGVVIKGYVVMGSNEGFASGGGYTAQRGKESSGFLKAVGNAQDNFDSLVFDAKTFQRPSKGYNEFILDNWEPTGVIVVGGRKNRGFAAALKIAQQANLALIDENQNPIEMEDSNETPT